MTSLVRIFMLLSALAAAFLIVAVIVFREMEIEQLVEITEAENVTLAQSIANSLGPILLSLRTDRSSTDGGEERPRADVKAIGDSVERVSADLPILKVKIYSPDGLTIYSSNSAEHGEDSSANAGFISARGGKPESELAFRDTFSSFSGTLYHRDIVETYIPIRDSTGAVAWVFEIYSDVTPLLAGVQRSAVRLVVIYALLFAVMYAVLFTIVRRAGAAIRRQHAEIETTNVALRKENAERVRAEAALKKAHDVLEERVELRTRELSDEIVERERAEQHLRTLWRAVEQNPAMTVITDVDGKIEYVNDRFTEVTGYGLEEVIGKTHRVVKSGEMSSQSYEDLWRTIRVGREWRGEMRNRNKAGDLYWVSLTIAPVIGPDGRVTHYVGISEDITGKKIAHEELRQQREELAHFGRVALMGEMATTLAHELNQPLTVIGGCTQACLTILSSNPGEAQKLLSYLEQADEQANRANEIIRQVREFIQKDRGKRDRIDMNETILGVADMLRSDAREHGADLRLDLASALPSVVADPFQIQQVVLNLAHNGMQAMDGLPTTSRRVTIQTLLGDNGEVKVVVHDSGNEITSETLERMFDPFFTTKPTGLGMGLSLCRSIAEAHGGKLWAKSDKESGTEFHFVLPTAEENRLHVA